MQIASRFAINEVEAALLLRSLRLHLGEEVGKDIEASRSKDDGFWETVTAFFFEERLAIVQVLSYILRSGGLAHSEFWEAELALASSHRPVRPHPQST